MASTLRQRVDLPGAGDLGDHRCRQRQPLRADAKNHDRLRGALQSQAAASRNAQWQSALYSAGGSRSRRDWAACEYTGQFWQCTCCASSGQDPSPRMPMVFQQSTGVMSLRPGRGQSPRAVPQRLGFRLLSLFLHQQREMHQRILMAWIQIQRLPVIDRRFSRVARRISHEPEHVEDLCRWALPAQLVLAAAGRFREVTLIGELDRFVRTRRLGWPGAGFRAGDRPEERGDDVPSRRRPRGRSPDLRDGCGPLRAARRHAPCETQTPSAPSPKRTHD